MFRVNTAFNGYRGFCETRLTLPHHRAQGIASADEFIAFAKQHDRALFRDCLPGHFTGSAWITDPAHTRVCLVFHTKLKKWLQPGGHADGEAAIDCVARREAEEETGLKRLVLKRLVPTQLVAKDQGDNPAIEIFDSEIFDLDRHLIPQTPKEPEHYHYDVRYWFEADPDEPLVISVESQDLRWWSLGELPRVTDEPSILRMVEKMGTWGG